MKRYTNILYRGCSKIIKCDFVGSPLELAEVYVRDVECDMVRRRECDAKILFVR